MKKVLFIILGLLLFSSCASSVTDESESAADVSAIDPVDILTEESDDRLSDNLPELDLEGWTMRIIAHRDNYSDSSTYFADEYTGEVVNDAIFERDAAIKDRFNCEFTLKEANGFGNEFVLLKNSVNAGGRDYDISFLLPYASGSSIITEGVLYNMTCVDYLNFAQPWWHNDINEEYTINGYLPFVAGDSLISAYQYANSIIYNKSMAEKNTAVDDLYELVRNGEWTFDAFQKTVELFTHDADGNGIFNKDDHYGFASNYGYHIITWGYASGDRSIYINEDGKSVTLGFGEKFIDTAAWLYELVYNSNHVFEIGWDMDCEIGWDSDQVFMQAIWLADLEKFRSCESNYGILPYPKYSEEQDKYYTYVDARAGALAIPIDAEKETISNVGLIMEAQACASHYDTIPVYMDSIQNSRYVRDEESIEMLEYIAEGRRWDIGYTLLGAGAGYVWMLDNFLKPSGGQIASYMKRLEGMTIKSFDRILTRYSDLAGLDWSK